MSFLLKIQVGDISAKEKCSQNNQKNRIASGTEIHTIQTWRPDKIIVNKKQNVSDISLTA